MRLQELTFGIEHQVSPHVAVSARFVHKQLDKAVEDIGSVDADGSATYVIGNPGYHRATEATPGVPYPRAVRDYDALELVGRKLLDRNWALTASYVWSRLYGNYSGLSQSDENGRTEPNIGSTFDAPLALFGGDGEPLYGRLATDRPHQAKAQLSTRRPLASTSACSSRWPAGCPSAASPCCHRASRRCSTQAAAVTAARRCCHRPTSPSNTCDRSVDAGALTLGLNVLNLFNQAQGVSRYSLETDQGVQVVIDEADYYAGRADVGAAIDEQNLPRYPRFLQYQFFQEPLTARVMLGFSF